MCYWLRDSDTDQCNRRKTPEINQQICIYLNVDNLLRQFHGKKIVFFQTHDGITKYQHTSKKKKKTTQILPRATQKLTEMNLDLNIKVKTIKFLGERLYDLEEDKY